MNVKMIGIWSLFVGMVLALTTVFVDLGAWITQILIVLGFLAGFFHPKIKNELITTGIIYLVLSAASGSGGDLIGLGPFIADIAGAWVDFLGPVVLAAFLIWGTPFFMVNKAIEKN